MPYVAGINPSFPGNPAAAPPYAASGTLGLADLLRVNNTPVIDFGEERVFLSIANYLREYSALVNENLDTFTFRTTKRVRGVGAPVLLQPTFTDEYGVPDVKKVAGAGQLGFPLIKHTFAMQWTYQWMRQHTPADMAMQAQAAANGDMKALQGKLASAIFSPTNYTFTDTLVDLMPVYVKAFCNADGFPIPASPSGLTFDATVHTHYTAVNSTWPAVADIDALLNNVSEHYTSGKLVMYVPMSFGNYLYSNRAATYTDFAPLTYTDQSYAVTLTLGIGTLNPFNAQNRQIGVYKGAAVWVKPWVPDGYIFLANNGSEAETKPIAMRVPLGLGGDNGDFRPIFKSAGFPTSVEILERQYGFGVNDRTAGAVLQFNGGSTTYGAPTLTF